LRSCYVGFLLVIADLVLDLEANKYFRVLFVADPDLAIEDVIVKRVKDSEPEINAEITIA
jgi:hypothetical protein